VVQCAHRYARQPGKGVDRVVAHGGRGVLVVFDGTFQA
jgi:hypothetical protein